MSRVRLTTLILSFVLLGFLAGAWYGRNSATPGTEAGGRKILYYVDPMNPAHTSDKPGLAPCGMKMEPVYADAAPTAKKPGHVPPGTVNITPEKQQLIGMRVEPVEKKTLQHQLRLLGKVAVDETRTYRINATVDGWITDTLPYATGTLVKKDQTLALFYSPEFLSAGQALLFALSSQDRVQAAASGNLSAAQSNQLTQFSINIKQYTDSLRNLGMGHQQIEEMIHTRKFQENVNIVAPADGMIAVRNVSQGQRFEKGTELYRIVDLGRAWILVDVFPTDAQFIKPGLEARVLAPHASQPLAAKIGEALPQFDNVSRTLKLRLEVDNPGYLLKPDMFVDVEFLVPLPESLVVPLDAVLDSGSRQIVYVERQNGCFEPRIVQAGQRLANEVQITGGLMPQERIVVSGNFFIDSESRMKLAAAGQQPRELAKDPVCGMVVYERDKAQSPAAEFGGKTYYFCCAGCKERFQQDPAKYLEPALKPTNSPPAKAHAM